MGERVTAAALDRPLPRALRALVVDALRVGVGEALPTNAHYHRSVGATAGTIQRAMAMLADQGALTVTSRRALGRHVETIDIGRAWMLSGLAPLRLLLPPGGPVEVEVLADALTEELTGLGLPHTVRHRRGGARRLDAVAEGTADVAVVSAGVLDAAAERLGEIHTRVLGAGTYYGPGRLVSVVRSGEVPGPGARVVVDQDSHDHVRLTQAEYPTAAGFSYVEGPFPEVPAAVLRGEVDAGIWHLSHSVIPLDLAGLACLPLRTTEAQKVSAAISPAALVGSPRRPELATAVASVRLTNLQRDQQRALTGPA